MNGLVIALFFLLGNNQVAQITEAKPCTSTTMDGLPNCEMPKMTSAQCLNIFPPDRVGGFCNWYGYSTTKQEDCFEKKRGFVRVKHADGSSDTWTKRYPVK